MAKDYSQKIRRHELEEGNGEISPSAHNDTIASFLVCLFWFWTL